jgi:capsular polysaccharide transport system ATP-binding protein
MNAPMPVAAAGVEDGVIQLRDIHKVYRTRSGPYTVLDGLDLTIRRGEALGIMGRNGAGKSTLTRIMTGVEPPTAGTVSRGMSISWPLGFMGAVQASLSGADNARFIARIYGRPIGPMLEAVEEFAELGRYFRMPVKTYSSGMMARLTFGLSLAVDFDCYVADEITGVGDYRFAERCHAAMMARLERGALVMISHSPDALKTYCNRAAVLDRGKLTFCDTIDEAYEAYHAL